MKIIKKENKIIIKENNYLFYLLSLIFIIVGTLMFLGKFKENNKLLAIFFIIAGLFTLIILKNKKTILDKNQNNISYNEKNLLKGMQEQFPITTAKKLIIQEANSKKMNSNSFNRTSVKYYVSLELENKTLELGSFNPPKIMGFQIGVSKKIETIKEIGLFLNIPVEERKAPSIGDLGKIIGEQIKQAQQNYEAPKNQ